jgi:hypothetical protein
MRVGPKPHPDTPLNEIFGAYKRNAAKRKNGIDFKLSKREFEYLIQMDCHYCGAEPSNVMRKKRVTKIPGYRYNGIDRIDNDKGYQLDNVVPCCMWCNRMKKGLTYDMFIKQANAISRVHNG